MISLLATALTVLAAPLPAACPVLPVPQSEAPRADELTLDERIERLIDTLEAERVKNHIPGFALAVVKEDEVILAHGFGLADIEQGRAVDAETIFAIGSSTKAFTATVIGMQQDAGVMRFDDPVTDYLPYFELPIKGPDGKGDATVTVRDLLCHRTGFTRMTMLWFTSDAPVETILKTAVRAEPWAGFREQFLYNNVMFLAAGTASGIAANTSWENLIHTRIFDPLDMSASTTSVREAQKDERLATGYAWNEDTEDFDVKRMLEITTIGPAGSINSNVTDMARWLRFQLGRGEFEGERLISEDAHKDTWTASMSMGGNAGYGLGWMLREYMDQPVVEHGGNIDGFSSTVAMMPESDLGFVLLANVNVSPIQRSVIATVFDALLGEIVEETVIPEGEFAQYIGIYNANFATFDNEEFEVLVQNGNLSVDIPGQMIFELHAPDDEDKWVFRLTDQVAVSFGRNEDGDVVALNMHQSGMTFDLPRKGVEVPLELPLEEFDRFLGRYLNEDLKDPIEVLIEGGHLALDVPGERVFELHVPDDEGWRRFRMSDEILVRFNEEDGIITSFTLSEKGEEHDALRLPEDVDPEALLVPTLEEFFELRNGGGYAALLKEHGTMRVTGKIRLAQSGVEGTFVLETRNDPPASRMAIDLGVFGGSLSGAGAGEAWSYNKAQGYRSLSGSELKLVLWSHPSRVDGDWRDAFDSLSIVRVEPDGDREVLVVRGKSADLAPRTMLVDVDTGRLLQMDFMYVQGPVRLPFTSTFGDFREVSGVFVAHHAIESNDSTGRSIQSTESVELGVELAPDFYLYEGAKD